MAGKKNSKKKNKRGNQKAQSSNSLQALGANVGEIGTVVAGAVVGELAQRSIGRTLNSSANSQRIHAARESVNDAVSAVKAAFGDAKPAVLEALESVKDAIGDAAPAAEHSVESAQEAVTDVKDRVLDAVPNFSTDRVQHTVDSSPVGEVAATVENLVTQPRETAAEVVDTAVEAVKATAKGRKSGKAGKKAGKKAAKGRKKGKK